MLTLDTMLGHLREHGLKVTEQRRLIVAQIIAGGNTVEVGALIKRVREKQPDISIDTIYRTLALLCATDMLCKIAKSGRGSEYEIIAGKHLHYMICSHCGCREPFEDCFFEAEALSQGQKKGFLLTGHKLELYGVCPLCLKKGDRYEKIV